MWRSGGPSWRWGRLLVLQYVLLIVESHMSIMMHRLLRVCGGM